MNKSLYQRSAFWLILFFAFAVFGFWKSYYSPLEKDLSFYQHFHGISMTVWCLMLIGQAFLIRYKKFSVHRMVGRGSFVVFPILIISTFLLIHSSLGSSGGINTRTLYSMALMVNATWF